MSFRENKNANTKENPQTTYHLHRLSVPCAVKGMTNCISLQKPSLSCLRIFRLRSRKKECSASGWCEEVLRSSVRLLACTPTIFQAPFPRRFRFVRSQGHGEKSSPGYFSSGVLCTVIQPQEAKDWLNCLTDPAEALGQLLCVCVRKRDMGLVCLYLSISLLESGVQKTRAGGGLRQKRDLSLWQKRQGNSQESDPPAGEAPRGPSVRRSCGGHWLPGNAERACQPELCTAFRLSPLKSQRVKGGPA